MGKEEISAPYEIWERATARPTNPTAMKNLVQDTSLTPAVFLQRRTIPHSDAASPRIRFLMGCDFGSHAISGWATARYSSPLGGKVWWWKGESEPKGPKASE